MKSAVVAVAWRCRAGPRPQQPEEGVVADEEAQRVQRERAALVDAVVEHAGGPGSPMSEVLRAAAASAGVVVAREPVGRGRARGLRPQPLGVAGEALVEPDVLPAGDADAVAEPLVRELVRDEPLVTAAPSSGSRRRSPMPCASSGISSSSAVTTTA